MPRSRFEDPNDCSASRRSCGTQQRMVFTRERPSLGNDHIRFDLCVTGTLARSPKHQHLSCEQSAAIPHVSTNCSTAQVDTPSRSLRLAPRDVSDVHTSGPQPAPSILPSSVACRPVVPTTPPFVRLCPCKVRWVPRLC